MVVFADGLAVKAVPIPRAAEVFHADKSGKAGLLAVELVVVVVW